MNFAPEAAASAATATLAALSELVRRELHSDLNDITSSSDKSVPSTETGELGVKDGWDRAHLMVTLGISTSGFDALGVPQADRPQDLISAPWADFKDEAPARAPRSRCSIL